MGPIPKQLDDPTLPSGWRAVLDPASGYTYYWNTVTNETTYDRPVQPAQKKPSFENERAAAMSSSSSSSSAAVVSSSSSFGYQNQQSRESGEDRHYHQRHQEHEKRAERLPAVTSADILSPREYRKAHDMTVEGDGVIPDPFQTFDAAGFTSDILNEIDRAGFKQPTPIQGQSWSIAMQGRDLVAIAKTGSGKTCGYMLPGLMHIRATRKDPRMGPTVLVLAPTRELAVQIKDEADKFGSSGGFRSVCLYGGAPKGPQYRDIRFGVHIVIATPGRLNDFLEAGSISLAQVSYLVLDEADRMLDMGFEPQIKKIATFVPRQRQTLFYSATWPKEVRSIANEFAAHHPVHIFIGSADSLAANKDIRQHVIVLDSPMEKDGRIVQILKSLPVGSKIIIFCGTKRTCDQLARFLGRDFGAMAIHGDKNQSERDMVLRLFKTNQRPIMVATDVAARGLDIDNVHAVINYDFPNGVEDYVHRIGRTGRAGAKGEAFTFLTFADARHARQLIQVMRDAGQDIPSELQRLRDIPGPKKGPGPMGRGGGGGGGGGGYFNPNMIPVAGRGFGGFAASAHFHVNNNKFYGRSEPSTPFINPGFGRSEEPSPFSTRSEPGSIPRGGFGPANGSNAYTSSLLPGSNSYPSNSNAAPIIDNVNGNGQDADKRGGGAHYGVPGSANDNDRGLDTRKRSRDDDDRDYKERNRDHKDRDYKERDRDYKERDRDYKDRLGGGDRSRERERDYKDKDRDYDRDKERDHKDRGRDYYDRSKERERDRERYREVDYTQRHPRDERDRSPVR